MSGVKTQVGRSPKSSRLQRRAALFFVSLGFVVLMTQTGKGQPPDALTFFKNYFVTGNYFVYGVPLKGTGVNGLATGTITVPADSVPPGGQAIAAHLYWSSVVTLADPGAGRVGAKFRGQDISESSEILTPAGTSPCWAEGGGTGNSQGSKILVLYHADVLRFFQQDSSGEFLVNAPHEVILPDSGGGNATPFTLGASLLVVYRTATDPLRAIVIYDGGFTMDQGTDSVHQTIKGFYQASTNDPAAQMSLVISDAQENFPERLRFNGFELTSPAIGSPAGPWDNPTWNVSDYLPGDASSASVILDHVGTPFDCLTGGVLVFGTTVQDTDLDGLLDNWETSTAGYTCPPPSASSNCDPLGQQLPDLAAMDANPLRKDLFVELGYMKAIGSTSYGGTGVPQVTDPDGHSHLPLLPVLESVGAAFANAWSVTNPDGSTGISLHFDVGDNYQATPPTAQSPYIITVSDGARGGEFIAEKSCGPVVSPTCSFPEWPGTLGWKTGFEALKNAPVDPSGLELTPTEEDQCEISGTCRRRFDRVRKDMFHYLVVAHSLGVPKSFDPGPLASVPVTISGIGDKPGGDFMMTLGSWGNDFRGPEPIQIFTIAHELGHNLWRAHNGNPFSGFENNCNPQYLSVMNYMYQTKGLLNLLGEPQVDFSHVMNSDVNEISLPGGLGPMAYRAGWYAPRAGVHQTLQVTAATKHCDGSPLSQTEEDDRVAGGGYVRVDGTSLTTPPIDWNGDLNLNNDVGVAQDVTFNGTVNNGTTDTTKLLRGSEDWLSIAAFGLRQLGSRRSVNGLSLDAGRDGPGRDGPGRDGPGSADVGSMGDYGRDGPGRDGPGNEMDFDTATAFVHPPHSLKVERVSAKSATVSWKRGHVGTGAVTFLVYRVDGGVPISPAAFSKRVLIDETANLSTLDTKITAGKTYAYFALTKVTATGAISNMSNAFKYDALK